MGGSSVTPARRAHPESDAQRAFIRRVHLDARTKHVLLTAVPMGGKRNAREAARLKLEGALAGCPDLLCFEPARDDLVVGLAIEMKIGKNKPTPAQAYWHEELRRCRWRVEVCHSAEEAWVALCDHLGVAPA